MECMSALAHLKSVPWFKVPWILPSTLPSQVPHHVFTRYYCTDHRQGFSLTLDMRAAAYQKHRVVTGRHDLHNHNASKTKKARANHYINSISKTSSYYACLRLARGPSPLLWPAAFPKSRLS